METLRILFLFGIYLFLILSKQTTTSQGDEISDRARIKDLQERVLRMEALILSIMKTNNDTLERIANLESSIATPVIPITVHPTAIIPRNKSLGKCYNSLCWRYLNSGSGKWCYTRRPESNGVVTCTGILSENCDDTWGCNL